MSEADAEHYMICCWLTVGDKAAACKAHGQAADKQVWPAQPGTLTVIDGLFHDSIVAASRLDFRHPWLAPGGEVA